MHAGRRQGALLYAARTSAAPVAERLLPPAVSGLAALTAAYAAYTVGFILLNLGLVIHL